MGGQQLWSYLTGHQTCPSRPELPPSLSYLPDGDEAARAALKSFEAAMDTYQSKLADYETWQREEACAKAVLLASMEINLSLSLRGFSTSQQMWAHLRQSYEIRNEAMYIAVVEEAQSLR